MKQTAIRCVGAVLAIVGIMKFHSMLGFFFSFLPYARKLARDGLPVPGLESALILHCVFGTISILKIIGGIGLLGLRPWAKWIAAVAALSHVLFSVYGGIPIWIRMANGTFENPAGIPMWKDFVTVAVNLVIAVTILTCMRRSKEATGTTTNCTLSAGAAEA